MKKKLAPELRPTALLRYFKSVGRLMLAEHDGDLWITESYFVARLTGSGLTAVDDLLGLYNLPCEPMTCNVDSTIVRIDLDPPTVGRLLEKAGQGTNSAARFRVGAVPVLVEDGKGVLELWEAAGLRFAMNPQVIGLADRFAPDGEWRIQGDAIKPLVKVHEGKQVALAMPVRTILTLADEEQAA